MGKMHLGKPEDKNPVPAVTEQAGENDAVETVEANQPVPTLVERLATGQAIKTSLYLERDVHRALKRLAADLSYGTDQDGTVHGAISAQDVILLGIGMALEALGKDGVPCGNQALLGIDR